MDDTDWGVVLEQGRYWRPDIGKFLSDAEYKEVNMTESKLHFSDVKSELYLYNADEVTITQPKEIRELSFTGKNGNVIGKFSWDNELKFEGNAEESAKVFIKWLKELWNLA